MSRTRIMYDSTTPAAIPRSAEMVAGYVNGEFAWTKEEWSLFPHAAKVHISVRAVNDGNVLDIETGDATPDQAPTWVKARRQAGHIRPTLYVNRANAEAAIAACEKEQLQPGHQFWIWLATLDGSDPHDLPGIVAIQDKSAAMLGFNADASTVFDATWHPTPLTEMEKFARIAVLADEIAKLARS
jgi:hypothetical protein